MLSQHLAELYEVEPRALNQAVKRNIECFPADFIFQLSAEEFAALRSQYGTSNLRSQIVISSLSEKWYAAGRKAKRMRITTTWRRNMAGLDEAVADSERVIWVSSEVTNNDMLASGKQLETDSYISDYSKLAGRYILRRLPN